MYVKLYVCWDYSTMNKEFLFIIHLFNLHYSEGLQYVCMYVCM